jgi:hypothetical protein
MVIMISVFIGVTAFSTRNSDWLSWVPAYNWYHGCGPTAAASVLGYWDLNGYDNLFTASGWDQVRLTSNVQDQISSPEHNARYDPTPDNTTAPESWNSIADWFRTSQGSLQYGWSYQSYASDAFIGYGDYRGYTVTSWYQGYGAFTWNVDDRNRCWTMMFLVDGSGDGSTDHFVPVLGYDNHRKRAVYGMYTTGRKETVVWEIHSMTSNDPWGRAGHLSIW